jgi:predicted PurR-regulated permease PerM
MSEQTPTFKLTRWQAFFGAAFICAAAYVLWKARGTLAPVFIALILSYMLDPLVRRLSSRRLSRNTTILLLLLGVFAALVGILFYVIPTVVFEMQGLIQSLPGFGQKLVAFYYDVLHPWVNDRFNVNLPQYPEELQSLLAGRVEQFLPKAWNYLQTGLSGAFAGTMGILGWLLNIILIPFFMFFFLRDYEEVTFAIRRNVPPRYLAFLQTLFQDINQKLNGYFRGTLIVMSILMVYYTVGLRIIGVQMSVLLGILSGFLFIIPFVGIFIAFLLCLIVAILNWTGPMTLIYIGGLYVIGSLIEGWALTPNITGDQVGLSDWQVMLCVMIFGSLFGLVGIMLAVPVGAIIKVLLTYFFENYRETSFFTFLSEEAFTERLTPDTALPENYPSMEIDLEKMKQIAENQEKIEKKSEVEKSGGKTEGKI